MVWFDTDFGVGWAWGVSTCAGEVTVEAVRAGKGAVGGSGRGPSIITQCCCTTFSGLTPFGFLNLTQIIRSAAELSTEAQPLLAAIQQQQQQLNHMQQLLEAKQGCCTIM